MMLAEMQTNVHWIRLSDLYTSEPGCRRKRQTCMRVVARLRRNAMSRAWLTWLLAVDESAAGDAADCHRRQVLMREALVCLHTHRVHQLLLRQHIAAMWLRWQRMAWNAWVGQLQGARIKMAFADGLRVKVVERHSLQTKAACFAELRTWVVQQQACRELLAKVTYTCSQTSLNS